MSNTTGAYNIAIGGGAGRLNDTGWFNIDIDNEGSAADTGTIRIGRADRQTRAFIVGIYGTTTGGTGVPVVVDANGQLGTVSSSRRFKDEIRDMGKDSDSLFSLRPVTFKYKKPQQDGSRPLHYGLIAEEVADVYPELVAFDRDTRTPQTVLYQELPVMLLNELKKQRLEARRQRELVNELRRELKEIKAALAERPAAE
jgi:hypothetical protein